VSIYFRVPLSCPRLLINRERVGCENKAASLFSSLAGAVGLESIIKLLGGLQFDSPDNIRDVALLGNCDDGVQTIADKLGWGVSVFFKLFFVSLKYVLFMFQDELRLLVKTEHDKIDLKAISSAVTAPAVFPPADSP
jgi:hypothetical protein